MSQINDTFLLNTAPTNNQTFVLTEEIKVWPLWVEITVPLICIILFVFTLLIIYLKPSKPTDEPFFYNMGIFKSRQKPKVVFVVNKHDVVSTEEEEERDRLNVVVL